MLASASAPVHPCTRPPALWIHTGHRQTQTPGNAAARLDKTVVRALPAVHGNRWTPWTHGHLRHGPMHRGPRYRATAQAHRPTPCPKTGGHTTANLASGGVCSTARFAHRDQRVRTVHPRLRVEWHAGRYPVPWWVMMVLRHQAAPPAHPAHRLWKASRAGADTPKRVHR